MLVKEREHQRIGAPFQRVDGHWWLNQRGVHSSGYLNKPLSSENQISTMMTNDNPDTFHIKIRFEENGLEVVVYDNGSQQSLGGGSIVVHK